MGNGCCTENSIKTNNQNDNPIILQYKDINYLNLSINFITLKNIIESSEEVTIFAYLINTKSIPDFKNYIIASENNISNNISKRALENELENNIIICDDYEKCFEIIKESDENNQFIIITENLINNKAEKVKIIKKENINEIIFNNSEKKMYFIIKNHFLSLSSNETNFNPKSIVKQT